MKFLKYWFQLGIFIYIILVANFAESEAGNCEGPVDEEIAHWNQLQLLLKFEPDFMNSVAERREYIRRTRAILDTLDIPERRRRKLLRDLHKNGLTKRLSKALVAETEFEDEIEE